MDITDYAIYSLYASYVLVDTCVHYSQCINSLILLCFLVVFILVDLWVFVSAILSIIVLFFAHYVFSYTPSPKFGTFKMLDSQIYSISYASLFLLHLFFSAVYS